MSIDNSLALLESTVSEVKAALTAAGVVVAEGSTLRELPDQLVNSVETLTGTGVIPNLTGVVDGAELNKYYNYLQMEAENKEHTLAAIELDYAFNGITYNGCIYCPINERIYLLPAYIEVDPITSEPPTFLQYIDCKTKTIVNYDPGVSITNDNFNRLSVQSYIYVPLHNRVYFFKQDKAVRYIDCVTNQFVTIAGSTVTNVSNKLAYNHLQNRIYLSPHINLLIASSCSTWEYFDLETSEMVQYATGLTASDFSDTGAYGCAGYCPVQNRIYLCPNKQCDNQYWHYIDCSTNTVVAYEHGSTVTYTTGFDRFYDIIFSPAQNRMLLINNPAYNTGVMDYYIDCVTGAVVETTASGVLKCGYVSCSHLQRKMFFNGMYIDCDTHEVISMGYADGWFWYPIVVKNGYSSKENRCYLNFKVIPETSKIRLVFIQEFSTGNTPIQLRCR